MGNMILRVASKAKQASWEDTISKLISDMEDFKATLYEKKSHPPEFSDPQQSKKFIKSLKEVDALASKAWESLRDVKKALAPIDSSL